MIVLPRIYAGFSVEGYLPLIFASVVAGWVAHRFDYGWAKIQDAMVQGLTMALPAILILYVIGMLIGVWMTAGIVPAMISWGLSLLAPQVFLPASCAVCSVVSLVTGSSWSTAGTIGVALIGVGQAMGIDAGYTAGAVISGAYFGDKLSPMSETTNLAPAMAGADLFVHIRNMLWTTVPSWIISMVCFSVLGFSTGNAASQGSVQEIQSLIETAFAPSVLHVVAPITVFALVIRKKPALPSLLAGVGVAAVMGLLQGVSLPDLVNGAVSGYQPSTGSKVVDELLKRGGLSSVNNTVLLIICAMCFGGIMEGTGMLRNLAHTILRVARSQRSLIASTVLTSVGLNILAADQYLAIVVPGRMYAQAYSDRDLAPQNLSRALEDGGTITSALVPWNSCGAYMATTLGVATLSYAPYAIFNWVNPLVAMTFALLGVGLVAKGAGPTGAVDPREG